MIAESCPIEGSGQGVRGWFALSQVTVGYDHATHTSNEHALLLDFTNYDLATDARVGIELDLASGRKLHALLSIALERAEQAGV